MLGHFNNSYDYFYEIGYESIKMFIKEKSKNITDAQLRQVNMTRAEFDNTFDSMINGSIFDKESE